MRALQYAVPVNCLLIGALSLVLPIGPLTAAMMLDAFLLVMATIGIMSNAAVLVVPNIIIKLLLLFVMLFVGCVSIDTFHTHYFKNSASVIIEIENSDHGVGGVPAVRLDSRGIQSLTALVHRLPFIRTKCPV
ncbi:unnamed protein product [Angiostrongylus costaricensis]|uniref:Amino acid transporter n=1 Tax=Angiostrongylus costaricensis TaxID=334426 RepID=A0A0R3PXG6_ANGCS|nr:unnamed protein product [Angiostrongylus costaricensis]